MGFSPGSLTSITVIRTGMELFHAALLIIQEVYDASGLVQYVCLAEKI